MKLIKMKTLMRSIVACGTVLILMIFVEYANACNCETPVECQAYANADTIYVGDLISADVKVVEGREVITAEFRTIESLKGKSKKTMKATFGGGGCEPDFVVGRRYFVYDEPISKLPLVCNRTRELVYAAKDLEHARKIKNASPTYRVGGVIEGMPSIDVTKVQIEVLAGNKKYRIRPNKKGEFSFVSDTDVEFKVLIILPSKARIFMNVNGAVSIVDDVKVQYLTRLKANACDFRRLQIGKVID